MMTYSNSFQGRAVPFIHVCSEMTMLIECVRLMFLIAKLLSLSNSCHSTDRLLWSPTHRLFHYFAWTQLVLLKRWFLKIVIMQEKPPPPPQLLLVDPELGLKLLLLLSLGPYNSYRSSCPLEHPLFQSFLHPLSQWKLKSTAS